MKLGRWACSEGLGTARLLAMLVACWLVVGPGNAAAQGLDTVSPTRAQVLVTDSAQPPAADDPRWQDRPLAQDEPGPSAWYRVRFDRPVASPESSGPTMLYLPYFYGGGRILINGSPVAEVPRTTASLRVRWERPLLLPLPASALKSEGNELLIQAHAEYQGTSTVLPRLVVGTAADV